jgi:hypothetical protein
MRPTLGATALAMKKRILALVLGAMSLSCQAAQSGDSVAIGQPSVFWHNAEWQTYENGVWRPYGQPSRNTARLPSAGTIYMGPSSSRGVARVVRQERLHRGNESGGIGQPTIGIGQPNGIGQSAGGFGEPNVGIGQTTIGIGRPNVAVGQRNGIGQTTIGIGKPNTAPGANNTGIGKPSVGIGQPNGIGQPTIGIGKPMTFPPQQRSTSTDATR